MKIRSVATIKNRKLKVQRKCYVPNNNRKEDLLHIDSYPEKMKHFGRRKAEDKTGYVKIQEIDEL